ncbi:MAG: CHASE domain-containing protein [Sandaracinaceae bacterium]
MKLVTEAEHTRTGVLRAWVVPSLAVAVAYFVIARASLLLAIPPGFAAPIWPAAGVAVIALLRWPRAWPGILVGSIAANVQAIGEPASQAAIGIGVGATLQAALGAHLVRRWVGWPSTLESPKQILLFFAAIGPAAELVNATLGPLSLYVTGLVPADRLPLTMSVWWVGDTLGAVAAAPVLLAVLGRSQARWRRAATSLALPVGVVLSLVTLAYLGASWSERASEQARLDREVQQRADVLEREVAGYVEAVHAVALLHGARREGLSEEELLAFARGLRERHPAIFAVEWVPRVEARERPAFERELAARYPGFDSITERDGDARVSAASRSFYYPVALVEPLAPNASAIGFDLASHPDRLRAIRRALDRGQPTLSAPVTLVQETEGGRAVLLFVPVERRGLLIAVLRMSDLLAAVLPASRDRRAVELTDVAAGQGLHADADADAEADGMVLRSAVTMTAVDRQWQLTVSTAIAPVLVTWEPWAVLVAGGLLTWLLAVLLLVVTGQTARVARLVEERTAKLAASESRVRTIVDHVFDGVLSVDEDGVVAAMNPAAVRMFGDQVGEPFPSLFTDAPERPDGGPSLLELEGLRSDGQTFPLELALPAPSPERGGHATATVHDLTERKRVDRLKDEFLSTVSHELRTPLTSIRGALGITLGTMTATLPKRATDLLALADRNAHRLTALVDDLLDLGRASAGSLEIIQQRVSMSALVADAVDGVRTYASEREVGVAVEAHWEGDLWVDPQRMVQVLSNLLSNALKFSPEGGEVRLVALEQGERVRFEVHDRGPGVAPEHRERIFDRFHQADASDTRAVGGSGLGLAIAKEIVERSGGSIGVADREGGGAVFWVELRRPRREAAV